MEWRDCLRACALMALASLFLSSCAGAASGGTSVWIDAPADALTLDSMQPIEVEGHAGSPGGVSRVEIWVDGALIETLTELAPKGEFISYHTTWEPDAAGTYTVQAVAYSASGAESSTDSARVTFGAVIETPPTPAPETGCPTPVGGGPTPVSCEPASSGCPTPVGGGPTPVSCEAPIVNFWADPPEIEAGACSNVRWHTENVQGVVFGGQPQALDGSYEACLCATERYSLLVTYLDGTQDKPYVTVTVNGSCETEAPGDTDPPPAPNPMVPKDGLTIGCKGSQTLAWLPVQDASGIAKYHVQVQRHSGNGKWKGAPGGDLATDGKSVEVPVECGWYYRWRVSAIDGAGNTGAWSDWSEFTISLE
jgi:hypothetical protein